MLLILHLSINNVAKVGIFFELNKKISEKYDVLHISTGDIFRANVKEGTPLGLKAKEYMDMGALVPDELVCDLVEDRLTWDDCENGYLLDGFPRTEAQAVVLDEILERRGEALSGVISIMIPDSMVMDRIRHRAEIEGRADDARDEVIRHRIELYDQQTTPVLDYYRVSGLLVTVDGSGEIAETNGRICQTLDLVMNLKAKH